MLPRSTKDEERETPRSRFVCRDAEGGERERERNIPTPLILTVYCVAFNRGKIKIEIKKSNQN